MEAYINKYFFADILQSSDYLPPPARTAKGVFGRYLAVEIESAVEIELFPFYTTGSFSTAGSISTAISISTSVTLKSVILFLSDFLKSSCLDKTDSHFCLVYGKVY